MCENIVDKSYWDGLTDREINLHQKVGINTIRRVTRAFENDSPIALKGGER